MQSTNWWKGVLPPGKVSVLILVCMCSVTNIYIYLEFFGSSCWLFWQYLQFRSRLSYEQFSAFLANIRELNAQKQTREVGAEFLTQSICFKYYSLMCRVSRSIFSWITSVFSMFTFQETLRKAEEIFGMDNKDLYLLFQGLLNRNSH